jgi:hypothetical protein
MEMRYALIHLSGGAVVMVGSHDGTPPDYDDAALSLIELAPDQHPSTAHWYDGEAFLARERWTGDAAAIELVPDAAAIGGLPADSWVMIRATGMTPPLQSIVQADGDGSIMFDPLVGGDYEIVLYGSRSGLWGTVKARSLESWRSEIWERVKAHRDLVIDGGCAVPALGVFDTDPVSRSNINGAVTGAMLALQAGAPFSVDWKLADNSIATLSAMQMIVVGQAVLARVAAAHATSQELGLAILAAATWADLSAIDIEAGWPV